LNLTWAYQSPTTGSGRPPLVVDGIILTQRPNDVVAMDAMTGASSGYTATTTPTRSACCGANNRGLAILGDTAVHGTLDAHLIAIDTKSGAPSGTRKLVRASRAIRSPSRRLP
jgi:glucose dehydrogenase